MVKKKLFVESETLELKSSLSEKEEIFETISAFSNKKGGTILIGIDPSGTVLGVSIGKNTIENLAADIKQATDPKIFPEINVLKINSKQVIQIKIPEYPIKPVFVKDKVFIRVGKSNQKASADKIRWFINQQNRRHWDSEISSAKLSDLSDKKIKLFIRKYEDERDILIEFPSSTEAILRKLNLLKGKKPVNAAVLLFSKEPQLHFYNSIIKCARFKGNEAIDFLDFQDIEGTIIEQVPASLNFIRKHIKISAEIKGKPERDEIWEIPKEALREAIINAICHRDYESPANIQIRIFDNRLEIWNPGLLPENLSIDQLKKEHPSIPRNELIAKCFYMIKFIEQWGTGTNRIIRLCKEYGMKEPEFKQFGETFVVCFSRDLTEKKVPELKINLTQKKIIQFLSKVGKASSSEISNKLNVDQRTVTRNIKQLKEMIIWTGKSKKDPYGYYVLNENINFSDLIE